ncbi:MAG: DUF6249 domain-containing protein [Chloroflexota bacterium]
MADEEIVLFFTIPFMIMFIMATVGFITARYLQHRERMTYAKQGMYPPEETLRRGLRRGPTPPLRRGIILTLLGVVLTCGFLGIGFGPWLLGGLIPFGLGVAFLIIGTLEMMADSPASAASTEEIEEDDPIPPGKIQL